MLNIGFVYLPFTSPCMPPLGIPMLSAFLSHHSIMSNSYDLNIELYNVLLENDIVNRGNANITKIITEQLNDNPERLYMNSKLAKLLSIKIREERNKCELNKAIGVFKRKIKLKNYRELYRYSDIIYTTLQASTSELPYFNNNPMNYFVTLDYNKIELIQRDLSWKYILIWFYERLDKLCTENSILGFSLNYVTQIHFFLLATQYIREKYPDIKIIVGGPLATGILKGGDINIDKNFFKTYNQLVDAVIVEDGEFPLLDFINGKENQRIITYPFDQYYSVTSENNIPPLIVPNFESLPLDMYLAPELTLPLITARHCYWGKCYFCSHSIGYNHFENYDAELVINCLNEIVKKYNVRNFYFVDECTTPITARKIAEWVIQSKNNVKWMADMRLEPILTDIKFIQKLYFGGCRYIAFGLESINGRVLKVMNKGISSCNIQKIINNCYDSKINVNLMFFFGFPTETVEEAQETFNFILKNDDKISAIGMGAFTLTPQSYVYKHYKDFGIIKVLPNGDFVTTNDFNREKVQTFLCHCKNYINENYYRGHQFYHRTFYLIDIDCNDKSLYPLGFTSKVQIKKNHCILFNAKSKGYIYNDSLMELELKGKDDDNMILLNDEIPFNELFTIPVRDFNKLKAISFKTSKSMKEEILKLLVEGGLVVNE